MNVMENVINVKDVTYDGYLGKFVYNTANFELRNRYTEHGTFEVLVYRGRETNGANIVIPEGIINISYMFENTSIMTPPAIPESVEIMDYTFKDCASLNVGAGLPVNLKSCAFCYKNCRSMLYGSDMPDTVTSASYMYDGCTSLYSMGHVSVNLQYASGMCRNCKNLRMMPDIPETVERQDFIFKGCEALYGPDRMY